MTKETAEKWSAIIEDQKASGLTIEEYCRRNSISSSAFYSNKHRLAEHRLSDEAAPAFRKVKVSSSMYIEFDLDGHHVRCRKSDIRCMLEALQ